MSNLVPASLYRSMQRLRDSLTDTFERWVPDRLGRGTRDDEVWLPSLMTGAGAPAVDMVEDDDEVRVTAELPGLGKDDFSVNIEQDRLILRGEKKMSHEDKGRGYYYSECSYGSFARAIPLPCDVDVDKADASYKHGVLRVKLPKTAAAKARRTKVRVK